MEATRIIDIDQTRIVVRLCISYPHHRRSLGCNIGEWPIIQVQKTQSKHHQDCETNNPSKLHMSTTLVTNNIPQKETQSTIVDTTKKLFGENNNVKVSFKHAT